MPQCRWRIRHWPLALWLGGVVSCWSSSADGQEPPPPPPPTPTPSLPAPAPVTPQPPPAPTADPQALADQVRQLIELNQQQAAMNKKLNDQLGDLSKKYDELNGKIERSSKERRSSGSGNGTGEETGGESGADRANNTSAADNTKTGSSDVSGGGPVRDENTTGREGAGGGSGGGVRNQDTAQGVGNRQLGKIRVKTSYDYGRDGFLFESDDSEFQLKIRSLAQVDAHIYDQTNQQPVSSGLYVPRARYYFSGRMTKPIQYQVSVERSYSNFDLLNAYLNFDYDQRLNFRVGRFKTPYTYEYYKIPVQDLLTPERSLFNINFQGNRQIGAMAWGQLAKDRVEYAVGFFDGARKSYQAFHNGGDVVAFATFKPFQETDSFLKTLHLGGSVDYGYEDNPLNPAVMRTTSQVSTSSITSTDPTNTGNVPFLAFNNNVRNRGPRELWDLHFAYFYKGLTLLGAWNSGYESWALTGANPISVPVSGYFVQTGYLLTGETRNNNGLIDPLKPFNLKRGSFGPGAIEPTARFSAINLGREIFTGGLADPNLWTTSASSVDVGANWYLNKFTKIYFDWQHVVFGQPVYYRPGERQLTSDMFWLRFQLYF